MPVNPKQVSAAEYEREKKKRIDALYAITGNGIKILGISIVAYMAITSILAYFLHPDPSAITWGAAMVIGVEFPAWLVLVLLASRKLRRLRWELKVQ